MSHNGAPGSCKEAPDRAPFLVAGSPGVHFGRVCATPQVMALSRSEQMSRIRSRDTGPEKRLRSALWSRGLRYRLHARTPVGRPDIVFPGPRVAVFIDGCFWHGCPRHYVRPRSRERFWAEKLAENLQRDRRQTLELESLGWRVVRLWEHEVYEALEEVTSQVHRAISGVPDNRSPAWRVLRVEELDAAHNLERRHLVSLRDPGSTTYEDGPRVTAKWKRQGG